MKEQQQQNHPSQKIPVTITTLCRNKLSEENTTLREVRNHHQLLQQLFESNKQGQTRRGRKQTESGYQCSLIKKSIEKNPGKYSFGNWTLIH